MEDSDSSAAGISPLRPFTILGQVKTIQKTTVTKVRFFAEFKCRYLIRLWRGLDTFRKHSIPLAWLKIMVVMPLA